MDDHLDKIRHLLTQAPIMADYRAAREGDQIHLSSDQGDFARLKPEPQPRRWKMEFYLNRDRWRCYDFTGTLEECLELLYEAPHYLFWEG